MAKKNDPQVQAAPIAPDNPSPASDAAKLYQEIALNAYFRAQARGFAPGGEQQDWIEAEREVNAAHAEQA
jgi:hypothetical protein